MSLTRNNKSVNKVGRGNPSDALNFMLSFMRGPQGLIKTDKAPQIHQQQRSANLIFKLHISMASARNATATKEPSCE